MCKGNLCFHWKESDKERRNGAFPPQLESMRNLRKEELEITLNAIGMGLRPKPGRGAAALRPLRRPRAPGETPGPRTVASKRRPRKNSADFGFWAT